VRRHDEVFIHLTECLDSLNRSWRIIDDLEQVKLPPVLWSAAYGRALIEYSKPYKDSYEANNGGGNPMWRMSTNISSAPRKQAPPFFRSLGRRNMVIAAMAPQIPKAMSGASHRRFVV